SILHYIFYFFFFFQAEDGIRDFHVTGVQTCALRSPFSNIGLSLGEDAAVLGGLALMHFNPLLALIILLIAIGAFFYFALRILRATKAKIWLAWKKLNGPADRGLPVKLPRSEERRVGKECRCGWSRYE